MVERPTQNGEKRTRLTHQSAERKKNVDINSNNNPNRQRKAHRARRSGITQSTPHTEREKKTLCV